MVAHEVGRVVGAVGHHDRHGVTRRTCRARRAPRTRSRGGSATAGSGCAGSRVGEPSHDGRRSRRCSRRRRRGSRSRSRLRSRRRRSSSTRRRRSTPTSLRAGMTTESFTRDRPSTARRSARGSPQDRLDVVVQLPVGIVALERGQVADPPAVVADAGLVAELPVAAHGRRSARKRRSPRASSSCCTARRRCCRPRRRAARGGTRRRRGPGRRCGCCPAPACRRSRRPCTARRSTVQRIRYARNPCSSAPAWFGPVRQPPRKHTVGIPK